VTLLRSSVTPRQGSILCASSGVITLRGRPFEVDDTLVYLTKSL
jgi:hypothetical protein